MITYVINNCKLNKCNFRNFCIMLLTEHGFYVDIFKVDFLKNGLITCFYFGMGFHWDN